jgi:hypothetical protein
VLRSVFLQSTSTLYKQFCIPHLSWGRWNSSPYTRNTSEAVPEKCVLGVVALCIVCVILGPLHLILTLGTGYAITEFYDGDDVMILVNREI